MFHGGRGVPRAYAARSGHVELPDGRALLVASNGAVSYRLGRTLGYVWRMKTPGKTRWRWSGRRANGEALAQFSGDFRDQPSRQAAVRALAAALDAAGEVF